MQPLPSCKMTMVDFSFKWDRQRHFQMGIQILGQNLAPWRRYGPKIKI